MDFVPTDLAQLGSWGPALNQAGPHLIHPKPPGLSWLLKALKISIQFLLETRNSSFHAFLAILKPAEAMGRCVQSLWTPERLPESSGKF